MALTMQSSIDNTSSQNAEEPGGNTLADLLLEMKEAIWARRPILGDIMKKHGTETLHSYSQDFLDINKSPRLDARKPELIATVRELTEKRLGGEVADKLAAQLTKYPLISTADHHSPISHPFWVNANIISAIPYLTNADPDLRYLTVFSFSSVSLNNASGFSRGVLFHGGMNGSGNYVKLPLLPDKHKMSVVYGTRPYTREDLERATHELGKKAKAGEIAPGRGDKIRAMTEDHFGADDVLAAPDLASQITKINFRLWPKLFHAKDRKETVRTAAPDLIYLEIETIVTELLLKHHLLEPLSLINRILFGPKSRELVLKYFNNIPGGFSTEQGWGTYLFWALDDKQHRVRMDLTDGVLHSTERKHEFAWTPEAISEALRTKQLFPSMLLCYLVIALYYGMKCLGGFCQVHDLTVLKEAWMQCLREMGENEEADALIPLQTKELGGDGMVLAYLQTIKGEFIPATGLDMAVEDSSTSFETYVELSKQVTLSEVMNPMLPEIYTVLYTAEQRDPRFAHITPEKIFRGLRLRDKISHLIT